MWYTVSMADNKVKLHNKTDKPDNVVERENEIQERCEIIESELPKWMRGYFMYLKTSVLPMTRLSYLGDIRFFFSYLISDSVLAEKDTTASIRSSLRISMNLHR